MAATTLDRVATTIHDMAAAAGRATEGIIFAANQAERVADGVNLAAGHAGRIADAAQCFVDICAREVPRFVDAIERMAPPKPTNGKE